MTHSQQIWRSQSSKSTQIGKNDETRHERRINKQLINIDKMMEKNVSVESLSNKSDNLV